ncbi:MAG: Alcohol dehydrogenase zinc-binding domain protein [Adhaeribacter sp.]|nr:Alcohol dehydrogenase zinc-binding domain protein [Adhaeribacter sp.]
MKAAIRRSYGSFDTLKVETIEKPTAKDNEVLIRVYATTVNRTDCAVLMGKPFIMRFFTGFLTPKLPITGTDFAGRIEAVGKNVKAFKVADKVWGFNDLGLSSQAEYMVFPEDGAMAIIPESYTYEQAAASLEGAHYAYNFMNKVNLKPGDKILLNGATGAIGSVLLQFLKYYNLYVTAVCSTKDLELIKALGADRIYDYTREDFTEDDEKYNFVFDAVGKSTFAKCKALLKPGGVYISSELGPMAQNLFLPFITKVNGDKKVIFPVPSDIKRTINFIKTLIEEEKFKPVIDRKYLFDNISEAYRYVASGQKTGNVVISFENHT